MLFFMSKIKLIKLLLSIIFKRFAVFCGLIKRGLKCSKESLQHVGGFYPVHKLVEFMLMQNLLSLHRIFGACEAVDLPTSRAQIFTRARRVDFFNVFRGRRKRDRLSQSPSLLISGSGSWPQRESSRSLVRFYRRKHKKSTARASRS